MSQRIEDGGPAHTPGPWKFIDATKVASMQYAPKCVIQADHKQVASFSWHDASPWFPTKEESQANARLIAAAPDLLEALEAIVASLSEQDDEGLIEHAEQMIAARAAISRARQMGVQTGGEAHG